MLGPYRIQVQVVTQWGWVSYQIAYSVALPIKLPDLGAENMEIGVRRFYSKTWIAFLVSSKSRHCMESFLHTELEPTIIVSCQIRIRFKRRFPSGIKLASALLRNPLSVAFRTTRTHPAQLRCEMTHSKNMFSIENWTYSGVSEEPRQICYRRLKSLSAFSYTLAHVATNSN